ncbi:unnamed protein product [Anisakis simplex]|uniref:DUF202 domain-containing protein n=1 Tax=Anisakis simplex TaxID=6269 RepID=A0A0M3KEY4_ANISI|nr:unnamed protein product [Anisakis simplex]
MSFVEHASPYHQYQQSPSQMAAASAIGSPPDQMNPQTSHVGPNVNPIQGTTKLSNSLNEWFEQMIEMRRLKALLCHAAFSSALYLLFACVLQISLVHPIGTIYG